MRLTIRRLFLAGLAAALFSGLGLASAAAAEPGPVAGTDTVSPAGTETSLPGGDSTVPGAALALLLTSAGLARVVRRSAPAPVTVTVDEVAARRPAAGSQPASVPNPAAA